MTYKDKLIWITGASSGIGEAMTYAFAKEGARLVISARRLDELKRVKANCLDPEKVEPLVLDIADYKNTDVNIKPMLERVGPVDLLVNNAGISQRAFAKDTEMEVYERIMNVNLLGTIAMTKAVLPAMLKQKSGHIAVVTSLTGKFSTPLRTGYAASKHALHGFFDGLRAEVWKENIQVSIICPGFIKTNIAVCALTGDGNKHNQRDDAIANGLEPSFAAEKIINGLKSGKEEIYIAGKEMVAVYLKRFFPSLFSRLIKKAKVT